MGAFGWVLLMLSPLSVGAVKDGEAPTEARVFEARDDGAASGGVPVSPRVQVGVRVFALEDDEHPAVPREWFRARLDHANRLFDPIGVEFVVDSWQRLRVASAAVDTRAQRDGLGAANPHQGQVDVYLVSRLTDVDAPPAEIRGVHWRLRRDISQRWVIMSAISGPMVLAHELGHFFSLPHGVETTSIMNKRPRSDPPWEERVFTRREQTTMVAALKRMLESRRLVPRKTR